MSKPDPTRYKLGVQSYARGQARAQGLGLNLSADDPSEWEGRAHAAGMGNASGITARHRVAGPPLVSQDEFKEALHGTFEKDLPTYTPERTKQAVSYMGAQAANDYGTHVRKMDAHRQRHG